MKKVLTMMLMLLAMSALMVSCDKDDEPTPEQIMIYEILKSHEWVLSENGGSYTFYRFGENNQCIKEYYDYEGENYKNKTVEYSLSGQSLNIDGYNYEVSIANQHRLILKNNMGTNNLWDSSDDYIRPLVVGNWEMYIGDESYHVMSYKEDGTYEFLGNYDSFISMNVHESGRYIVEKMRIVYNGVEDGVSVNYSQPLVLLEDNKIKFGKLEYSRITDGIGNPPGYETLHSPYLKDITTGLWIEFDTLLMDNPTIYTFNSTTLECTTTFYSYTDSEYRSYNSIFKILGNRLYSNRDYESSFFIIEDREDGISLKPEHEYDSDYGTYYNTTVIYRYIDAQHFYRDHLVGEWKITYDDGDWKYLQFNEDGTYECHEYTKIIDRYFELKGKVSLDLVWLTVTHDVYTDQEDAVNEGYIWQPETCLLKSVCELDNRKVLQITGHNVLTGSYYKINNYIR